MEAVPPVWPQQVAGEAYWRLWNARKPFIDRGSALDPAGVAYSAPQTP